MLTRGVGLLLAAQFVSGLADNALLVVTIARLMELNGEAWLAPLLKLFFTIAYVVFAPFVGAWADLWPKGRVMFASNLLKALACGAIVAGLDPLAAFALAGFGAACYSPAKYGLMTELVAPEDLVRANGWLEASTVCAIILGTVLGGVLVSPAWLAWPALDVIDAAMPYATELGPALLCVLAAYLVAGAINLAIPDSNVRHARRPMALPHLLQRFAHANAKLWKDPEGGLSLAVTSIFWGAGALLQFAVLAWAQEALLLGLHRAAYLQGVVAIGITLGAAAAGRFVRLAQARHVLPLGVIMGLAVPLLLFVDSVPVAIPLLATVGALAGFFVVPMNALLQHRGCHLLRSGESIAVQNFNENLGVLAALGAYSCLVAAHWPLYALLLAVGTFVAGCMGWMIYRQRVTSAGLETGQP